MNRKRMLLEATGGSEVVQNEESRPRKLRFILRDRTITNHLDQLDSISDENVLVQVLLDIWSFCPLPHHDAENLVRRLLDHFLKQAHLQIQIRILQTIERILAAPWFPAHKIDTKRLTKQIFELFLEVYIDEIHESLLAVVLKLIEVCEIDLKQADKIVSIAKSFIPSNSWNARQFSLRILNRLSIIQYENTFRMQPPTTPMQSSPKKLVRSASTSSIVNDTAQSLEINIEGILNSAICDQDSRVRVAALECLVDLHTVQKRLGLQLYSQICKELNDTFESVRLIALRLVATFALSHAESSVTGSSSSIQLRLVDDAFSRLCNAMHDLSPEVRAKAAFLLGDFTAVSQKFLDQTFDKKLMSHMRFAKLSQLNIFRNQYLSEWATGKAFGKDSPAELAEEESSSIMPSGACGAFVVGLEDEFNAVRNASLTAICNLAESNASFARISLDFVSDMFNDEIHEVRLNAIKCLKRICGSLCLKEEQTEIILNALDDACADSREALRDLLSVCSFSTHICLRIVVDALLKNLHRFPSDKRSIWRCMKALGACHSSFAQTLVRELLCLHPFLTLKEPSVDDPSYIARLILLLNACYQCPTLKSLLPSFAWRHYRFLRDSEPSLVPCLNRFQTTTLTENTPEEDETRIRKFVSLVLNRLQDLNSINSSVVSRLLDNIYKDLKDASGLEKQQNSPIEFVTVFCHVLCSLELHKKIVSGGVSLSQSQLHHLLMALKVTYNLEHQFIVSSNIDHISILNLRLRVLCYLMVDIPSLWSLYLNVLTNMRTLFSQISPSLPADRSNDFDIGTSEWVSQCSTVLDKLEITSGDLGPDNVKSTAEKLIECFEEKSSFSLLPSSSVMNIVCRKIEMVEPNDTSTSLSHDQPVLKFVAGLVASVDVKANLINFDLDALCNFLRVQVIPPDQRRQLYKPRRSDFTVIDNNLIQLSTRALIAENVWSESSTIEIGLVWLLPDELANQIRQSEYFDDFEFTVLPLDKCVKIRVLPKTKC